MSSFGFEGSKKPVVLYDPAVMERSDLDRVDTYSGSDIGYLDSSDLLYLYNNRVPLETPPVKPSGHNFVHSPLRSLAGTTDTAGTTQKAKYRVLGTVSLTALIYCASCGGPVGSESLISAGGPLLGVIGILTYAVLCQTPISVMITELCCAFPENGGYAVWAMTAFGPFWGFQVGYWAWIASVTTNAIYPGAIYSVIADSFGVVATSGVVEFFVKAAIALLLAIPSFVGVGFIGRGAVVVLILLLLAILTFSVWGFTESEHAWFRLTEVRASDQTTSESEDGGIDWTLLIHSLFWSFDGLYDISVIGGEVINPARTYPRVIFLAVILAVLTYILPLVSAVTSDKLPWIEFVEDSLPDIGEAIGGSALRQIATMTNVLGSMGLFTCSLFFKSFLIQGMAQSRLLPSVLRKRNLRFKTPQYALLLSVLVPLPLLGFDFEAILNMTNAFSGAVQVAMVLSMIQLRRSFPYLSRPVSMPGNLLVVCVCLLPALCVFVFAIVTTLIKWDLALVVAGLGIPGIIYPFVQQRLAGHSGCC